jgi:hypothetical protein
MSTSIREGHSAPILWVLSCSWSCSLPCCVLRTACVYLVAGMVDRLRCNSLGAEGGAAIAAVLHFVPLLSTLGYARIYCGSTQVVPCEVVPGSRVQFVVCVGCGTWEEWGLHSLLCSHAMLLDRVELECPPAAPYVHCRLDDNLIGADAGCTIMGALQHLPSLTSLEYVVQSLCAGAPLALEAVCDRLVDEP